MQRSRRDARKRRTSRAIVESFNRLVTRRRYEQIQIDQIIGDAEVGRSTFYEHFRSKDDVLKSAATGMLAVLADAVKDGEHSGRIACVLRHFLEVGPTALAMLCGPGARPMLDQLAELIEQRLAARAAVTNAALIPLSVAAQQIAASVFGLIGAWLARPGQCSADALAAALERSVRVQAVALVG